MSASALTKWRAVRTALPGKSALCRHGSAAAASASATPPHTPTEPGAALLAWLTSRGGSAPGVTIAPSPLGGAGLVAAAALPAATVLVSVPRAAMMSEAGLPPGGGRGGGGGGGGGPPLPFNPEAVRALAAHVPAELWGARLALGLLAHRAAGEASPLAPYVAALPSTFSTPLFFSGAAVRALGYAPLVAQVNKRARFITDFTARHLPAGAADVDAAFNGVAVDAGGLAWALSAVSSRAFRVGGPAAPPSLVPVIDMCNHARGAGAAARVVPGPGGGVALVASRALRRGEAVTISYGDALTNDDLLLDYGFLDPSNPADAVTMRLDAGLLGAGAALAGLDPPGPDAWRAAAAAGAGVAAAFSVSGGGGGGGGGAVEAKVTASQPHAGPRLLAAARIAAAARPSDLGRGAGDGAALGDAAAALPSPAAEAAAWRLVAALCIGSLAAFPTTAVEDRAVLKQGGLPADVALAMALAAGKKELLASAAAFAGERAKQAGGGGGSAAAQQQQQPARGPPAAATAKGFGARRKG